MHNSEHLLSFLKGEHRESDLYKLALFLEKPGDVYSKSGEVKGPGYTGGGKDLPKAEYGASEKSVWMTFSGSVVWPGSSIAARYAMIYNHRSKAVVHVEDFGKLKSSENDRFTVELPGTGEPLIKIGLK
jgi:hypothetical protein